MKQPITRRKELACQVIALTTACAVSGASAQLEEVIVTAQKHTQSVNDVGITVNAFSGDTLRDLGVTEAAEIALYTPGLSVNAAGATGVPVYTIRGVGALQDLTTSTSSTVGLYFDEVSIPYSVMSRGVVYDIERVEVLKGPQGDLYGRNTTAGQINWISRKPTDEFEAGFSASYGRFETFELDGFLSGPLTDNIQGRLAFKTVQSGEGWQESVTTGDELGEKDTTSIRTLLNFNIGDNANLLLNVHYVDDQSDNTANNPRIDGRRIG